MALRASRRAAMACSRAQAGLDARVAAVLGGQWGDEGKGKLADVLARALERAWLPWHKGYAAAGD